MWSEDFRLTLTLKIVFLEQIRLYTDTNEMNDGTR